MTDLVGNPTGSLETNSDRKAMNHCLNEQSATRADNETSPAKKMVECRLTVLVC